MASDPFRPPHSDYDSDSDIDADGEIAPLAGTRAQSMQRLQVGLFGLATMVLLVGLANIIMNNAQENQARVVPEAASTMAEPQEKAAQASDPLADAGVVPDLPAEAQPSASPAGPASLNQEDGDVPPPARP